MLVLLKVSMSFNAKVEFQPAMTPDDSAQAGLDVLGERWG